MEPNLDPQPQEIRNKGLGKILGGGERFPKPGSTNKPVPTTFNLGCFLGEIKGGEPFPPF